MSGRHRERRGIGRACVETLVSGAIILAMLLACGLAVAAGFVVFLEVVGR